MKRGVTKIVKKGVALVLSTVMIFECIPCNISKADGPSDWSILAGYLNITDATEGLPVGEVKNSQGSLLFTVEQSEMGWTFNRTIKLETDIIGSVDDTALIAHIDEGVGIWLDLNGHILNRGLIDSTGVPTNHDHGSAIEVTGGSLIIEDSNPDETHIGKIITGMWVPGDVTPDDPDKVEIKGGIITGGTGTKIDDTTFEGGAIYLNGNDATLDLFDATLCGNMATNGGAIYIKEGHVLALKNDASICYNNASNGGAIYNAGTDRIEVENNALISNNIALYGGAIFTSHDLDLTLSSYRFSGRIENNIASNGGAIYIDGNCKLDVKGGTIKGNEASTGNGGGIYNGGNGTVTILEGTIIKENRATARDGGGVYGGTGTVELKGAEIKDNTATSGSAIKMTTGEITVDQSKNNNVSGKIEKDDGTTEELFLVNVSSDYKEVITTDPKLGPSNELVTISSSVPYDYFTVNGERINGNTYTLDDESITVSLVEPQASGVKKYKTINVNDANIKILGTGKKGSKRTIVSNDERKVENISVTDKQGNKIDVTKNEDGTYSFIQPASDVNVEVSYKNREIILNIGSTKASVDGETSNLDVCPVIRNDRTMLPIRFVAENLGAKVEWDEKNPNYVLITKGDIKIEITLGSDTMKVNGKDVKLDSASFAENDRTYLPVRAVSENLNAIVEWNETRPMEVKIYER